MRWKTLAVLLPAVLLVGVPARGGDLAHVHAMVEKGQATEALADLDLYLEEFPLDPEATFLRALVLAQTQHQEEAREGFEEVSNLRPDRPEPLNNLAVIQAALGDYDTAVETLKRALRTHPAYRAAYENLTKIYGQLASEAYSRALSVDQAHDRSEVKLVLLSEMALPELEPVQTAQVPAQPLPSAGVGDAVPMPAEVAVDTDEVAVQTGAEPDQRKDSLGEVAEFAQTPTQAITDDLPQGRDQEVDVVAEPGSNERVSAGSGPDSRVSAEPSELADLVKAWARAWSEQRVEDYLYFYSQTFEPPDGLSRADWEQFRRARVSVPEFVRVSVAFLDFETADVDRALVRFNQSYESDTFSDVVTKTLELVREDGSWKIASESVDS